MNGWLNKARNNVGNAEEEKEPAKDTKAARDKDLARHYEAKNRLIQRFESIKFIMRLLALGQRVILDQKDEILLTQGIPSGDSTMIAASGAVSPNNASPRGTFDASKTFTDQQRNNSKLIIPKKKRLWQQSPSKNESRRIDNNSELRNLLKEVIQPDQIFIKGKTLSGNPQVPEMKQAKNQN